MRHEVRLDVFEGPIDLLLHLITRRRVDIYEVPLAAITEDFLAAIADLEDLDLESATGFLIVAATLLELKSARLLPERYDDEGSRSLLEERDMLLARLVECATYREAGAWLRAGLAEGERYVGRRGVLEPVFARLAPDVLARVSLDQLAAAAAAALAPKAQPELDVSHVAPIKASVRDAIEDIAGRLQGSATGSFSALCAGVDARIDVVVRFLALLELFKAGAVDLEQVDFTGDIVVRWTGAVTAQEVVEEAEEYSVDAGAMRVRDGHHSAKEAETGGDRGRS
jgi:segregation and condensation protein A